jgi:nucleoside-diphosphate-sugar epimerase
MSNKKLNILIIGNGYVACYLKKHANKNFNIYILSKKKFFLNKKIKNIDVLIHSVGLNLYESFKNRRKAILIKKKITEEIIKFCKLNHITKIIYLSSANVYSKNLFGSINEKTKLKNIHPYAKAHSVAENMLIKNNNDHIKIIIIRLSNLFGINNCNSKNQFLYSINNFLKQAKNKNKIVVKNNVIIRDFLPMNYFIKMLPKLIAINNKIQIINLGYRSYRLIDIAKLIVMRCKKLFNYSPEIIISKKFKNDKKFLSYESLFLKKNTKSDLIIKEIDSSLKFLKF